MEQNTVPRRKTLFIKILIPFLIVIVICGMWLIKTANDKHINEISTSQNNSDLPEHLKDADFTLSETGEIDFVALSEYRLPIIVDYGSDSCVPCKQMAPALQVLNADMYGKAFVKFVDVWKYSSAAANVPVQVIPTQVIFNADGTPFVPSDELANEIEFSMYSDRNTGEHVFTTHHGGLTEEQMRKILAEMGVE